MPQPENIRTAKTLSEAPRRSGAIVSLAAGSMGLVLSILSQPAHALDPASCHETSTQLFATDRAAMRRSTEASGNQAAYCAARRQLLATVSAHRAWASQHRECGRNPDAWNRSIDTLGSLVGDISRYNEEICR